MRAGSSPNRGKVEECSFRGEVSTVLDEGMQCDLVDGRIQMGMTEKTTRQPPEFQPAGSSPHMSTLNLVSPWTLPPPGDWAARERLLSRHARRPERARPYGCSVKTPASTPPSEPWWTGRSPAES